MSLSGEIILLTGAIMSKRLVFTGDDVLISVELQKGGQPYFIDPASSVKATMYDSSGAETSDITLSNSETGADWSVGLVTMVFLQADVDLLTPGDTAIIQIRIAQPSLTPEKSEISGILIKEGRVSA